MTITIKIDTDNAAFEERGKEVEITRILSEWLQRGIIDRKLIDWNGNTVGSVKVTGK